MYSLSKTGEPTFLWAVAGSQGPNWLYANIKFQGAYEKGWRVNFNALPNIFSGSNFA